MGQPEGAHGLFFQTGTSWHFPNWAVLYPLSLSFGQGRHRLGPDRAIARRRGRDLGDAAHPDAVVVASAQQRGTGRGTQRRGMEAGELQTLRGQPLESWGGTGAAKRARGAEPDIVDEDDEDVGAPGGGRSGSMGANFAAGSLASTGTSPVNGRSGIGRTLRSRSSGMIGSDIRSAVRVTGGSKIVRHHDGAPSGWTRGSQATAGGWPGRTTHLNPRCPMEVSIVCAWRAAGR